MKSKQNGEAVEVLKKEKTNNKENSSEYVVTKIEKYNEKLSSINKLQIFAAIYCANNVINFLENVFVDPSSMMVRLSAIGIGISAWTITSFREEKMEIKEKIKTLSKKIQR